MRLRRRNAAIPQPKANPAKVAILEHELLGVQHDEGSYEAAAVAASRPIKQADCPHEDVIDVTTYGSARPVGLCRCGASMVETDDGAWVRP